MKKILTTSIALMMILCLVACGGNSVDDATNIVIPTNDPRETFPTTKETTESHNHIYSKRVVSPTCVDDGYTEYMCDCGDVYKDHYIDSEGHKWSEWKTIKNPTVNDNGKANRTCNRCGIDENKDLPKLEKDHLHDFTVVSNEAATCITEGLQVVQCTRCGCTYENIIKMANHVYDDTVIKPTCTERGYTLHKCNVCGRNYKEKYTSVMPHDYVSTIIELPSCAKVGREKCTCSICGTSYVKEIDRIEHSYKETVFKPTCTDSGYTMYKCECGETYNDNYIVAVGHSYPEGEITKKPSCNEEGIMTYTCSECKNQYTEAIDKIDHNYSNTTTDPTCKNDGYTRHECSVCGHSYNDTLIPAVGHNYRFTSDTATCTSDGVKTETCENCGDKKTKKTNATGHVNKTTTTVDANCVSDGYTKVTCDACGTELSNKVIPANGKHTFVTKRVPYAIKDFTEYWNSYEYTDWAAFTDWNVQACSWCKDIDMSTLSFIYSDHEAASIMLEYVNDLRESHFGTSDYNLTLDNDLISTAKGRAIQISSNFNHIGIHENIHSGYPSIYAQFKAWLNSSGHKDNMLCKDYTRFGYGIYVPNPSESNLGFGVQVFG